MRKRPLPENSSDASRSDLVAWRRGRLQCAGFEAALAEKLAGDRRFDLHAVLDLIDRGCPPELAARILAPLDAPVTEQR